MAQRISLASCFCFLLALSGSSCGGGALGPDGDAGPVHGDVVTGEACGADLDCAGNLCLHDAFTGGYCSGDCSSAPCAAGDLCLDVGGASRCVKPCAAAADCRSGYMCFRGACLPACAADADCGSGYRCTRGACEMLPGKGVGEPCDRDSDCASNDCPQAVGLCQLPCKAESDCPADRTCWVNPVDTDGNGHDDDISPLCIPRRKGAAVGAACSKDADCAQGQCLLGRCTLLCDGGACPSPLGCYTAFVPLDDGAPKVKACLPRQGTIDVDLPTPFLGVLGVPGNAVSLSLFAQAPNEDDAYVTGIDNLTDAMNRTLYSNNVAYDQNLLRYTPENGASMMLISNSPRIAFLPGSLYSFSPFALDNGVAGQVHVRARIKLHDGPLQSGTVSLHVFVTDLTGACVSFTAANARSALGNFESEIKSVFAQAHVTISDIEYFDSQATDVVTASTEAASPTLDATLKQATSGDDPDVLELVILKSIVTMGSGMGQILGIAGGIPGASGIPGSVRSGAVISVSNLCFRGAGDGTLFALVAAHELGHTLGLFHSVEADGTTDLFTDDDSDGASNLMYWSENAGTHLSALQSGAIRLNPVVQP